MVRSEPSPGALALLWGRVAGRANMESVLPMCLRAEWGAVVSKQEKKEITSRTGKEASSRAR
jgi:hypothetical protein